MDAAALLKGLSAAQSARLVSLLDESLDLRPAEREAWLNQRRGTDPQLADLLQNLLAAQGTLEQQAFLETLTPLERGPQLSDTSLIGKQFGPYRIVCLLGHGGMGSVWLAERVDGLFSRQVALKLIQSASAGHVLLERFTRERNILATLSHPNIARLFDAGFAEDGQPYLALEHIAGTPFKAYCDDHWLSVGARLEIFRQVLGAVQYAHARLVIHRDLKPSNILVSEDGQVHLLDFGIAKLLGEGAAQETELTQLGGRAMTPDYASPEQVAGAPVTIATDVYALGVMLYEILTGDRPYKLTHATRGALEEAILHAEPVPLSRVAMTDAIAQRRGTTTKKLAKILAGDLETIVLKALKKSPAERYATAAALSEDIYRYLHADGVLARRDSLRYRVRKYVSRHRIGIGVVGVLVLALLAGLAATSYEATVASRQRDAALEAQSRSLTQTAAARVKDGDSTSGLAIIQEVLASQPDGRAYTAEALSVFQDARAADREVLVVTGHADRVRSVAYSADGQRLLTASEDKTARIWDAATGQPLLELKGHTDRLRMAVFSPDGRTVATAAMDKTARIWDAATGRQLLQLLGHGEGLRSIGFSPDGQRVVTTSSDSTTRIWDVHTGAQLLILGGHANGTTSATFSPDGRRLVTTGRDPIAHVWDSTTGHEILQLSKHTGDLNWASFSADGNRIVTASFDTTARVWDATSGEQLMVLGGHTEPVVSAAFSPDGKRIVTCSNDRTARVWDTTSGAQLQTFRARQEMMNQVAFSPDGTQVATTSDGGVVRIWDTRQPAEVAVLSGHTQTLPGADYSADGRRFVTAGAGNLARIWEWQPEPLDVQVRWTRAAQFDPLVETERFRLGLPPGGRQWPASRSTCDEAAAAPYDPYRHAAGVALEEIVTDVAIEACSREKGSTEPQAVYQHGRALLAAGDPVGAGKDFERALAAGYPAAALELANLTEDISKKVSLYQQAWKRGVTVAGFKLGQLYEIGVRRGDPEGDIVLAPDATRAWDWYHQAANAGDPYALARLGQRAETGSPDEATSASLLEAFRYYAAAAERARAEDWPDTSWRNWRYRRAYLARRLARMGKMQDVANTYDGVVTSQSTARLR